MKEIQERIELLEKEKKLLEEINDLYKLIEANKPKYEPLPYIPVYPVIYPPYPQITYGRITTGYGTYVDN